MRGPARLVLGALIAATNLMGGACLEDAEVDDPARLASSVGEACRGRTGIMVVTNASGHEIIGMRLVDLDGRVPDLELTAKPPRPTSARYEILWQECGPLRPSRRRLLVDLAGGQRHQGDVSFDSSGAEWVFLLPDGILRVDAHWNAQDLLP